MTNEGGRYEMSTTQLKKIIFVCTGNTCRSPMAEYLLKKALKERKLKGFKVVSAGIHAKKGDVMNPKSAQVLTDHGVKLGKFSAKPITDKVLKESFLFICMTERHKDYLMDLRWNVLRKAGEENIENNIYSFSEFVGFDVPDPYGLDITHYEAVYEMLEGGMYALIDQLDLKSYALPPTLKPKTNSRKKTGSV